MLVFFSFSAFAQDVLYINSAEDLFNLSERVNGGDAMKGLTVVLTADLELCESFTPIGKTPQCAFSGSFDGGGHSITGLFVESEAYGGLFGCVTDGTVKNLKIKNARINGGDYCGIIVGRLYGYGGEALIDSCTASGTVNGNVYVGGVAGIALAAAYDKTADALVKSCEVHCTVNGDMYVGGVVGVAEARGNGRLATVNLADCKAYGQATANGEYGSMCGGICGALSAKRGGSNATAKLEGCTSYTRVTAENVAAGGVCGAVGTVGGGTLAVIEGCTALGMISGRVKLGGFCGKAENEGGTITVSNCISAGCVVGEEYHPIGFGVTEGCTVAKDPTGLETAGFALGDCNLDGEINSLDGAVLLKIDAAWGASGAFCDVNGDGNADSLDGALILRYDARIIDSF